MNPMAAFEIVLVDRTEQVQDVDAYSLEGPLTTFFTSASGRGVLDSWSVRQASYRTSDILRITRLEDRAGGVAKADRPAA